MPIIDRSYYGASQQGRDDAQREQANALLNRARQQEIDQTGYVNNLMRNPATTPEEFARAGRSDVANSLTGIQNNQAAQAKLFAEQMVNAAKYSQQVPAGQLKPFIEKNFPLLAQTYGPEWATANEEQVRGELGGIAAKFGTQAGIAPTPKFTQATGPRGSIIQTNPETNQQTQVVGPDNSQPGGSGPPSGYRWAANGQLEPIPGGPADPKVASNRNPNRVFQMADKLRDEFNALNKEFITVGDNYNIVRETAKDHSAAGDLSMIFAYMKMLDPNSVVREQEFANAQNAAGVPERVANAYNKLLSGERLNETQRADFINQAKNLYGIKKKRTEGVTKRYTDIANRNGVNPQDVVGDLSVYEDVPPTSSAAPAQAPGQWSIRPVGGK